MSHMLGANTATLDFVEAAAEAQKKQIVRAIKPVAGIEVLPPRLGPVRRVLLIVPPGHAALRGQVEDLIDTWATLAADAIQNGGRMYYGYPVGEALLRDPLSPLLGASGPDYERFKASRSMRDVEHVSSVEILDPFGNALA